MNAAAQHHPRRAGASLQLDSGMPPTGAETRNVEQRRWLKGARLAIDNDRVLVAFKPHEAN
jgi:hypothetical protein